MSFVGGIIAFMFGFILRLLFMLVSFAYNMIIVLANLDLFGFNSSTDTGIWHSLSTRIYILLGVFMLFRVGFSMLQYIVSPDKMTDKQQGIGNIIKRTVIALIILVLFQPAMSWAMKLQNTIVSTNILGTIILGVQGDSANEQQNMGETLPFTVIVSLTSISEDWANANQLDYDAKCGGGIITDVANKEEYKDCKDKIEEGLDDTKYNLDDGQDGLLNPVNWQRWFDVEITTKGTGLGLESATFQSNYLLLAIVAIIILFCLFSLGLQLGVRAIKLGFLAMIAPIPIISYIEPSQGKNGMLSKWALELGKTYLMLFIRLAALYFAILILVIVTNSNLDLFAGAKDYAGNNLTDNIFMLSQVKIIILIAAFIFADQVPKMLENIFNLKSEGGMFKSPFRQMRESKSLMGTVGGAAGATLGIARAAGTLGQIFGKGGSLSKAHGKVKAQGGWMKDGRFNMKKAQMAYKQYGTQLKKTGTSISNIGRSAKKTAKDLQENKQDSIKEAVIDSQTKAAEEGYNKLSRVGTSMTDKLLGKQFPLKEAKDKAATKTKAASGMVSDAESDVEKKENKYKSRKLQLEGTKAEYEAAKKAGKDSEIIKAEKVVAEAKNKEAALQEHVRQQAEIKAQKLQEKGAIMSQMQFNNSSLDRIDADLRRAEISGMPSGVLESLKKEKTKIAFENQDLMQQVGSIDTEIERINGSISSKQAEISTAGQAVAKAEKSLDQVQKSFEARMEEKRNEINIQDKMLDDYKKAYASEKIETRVKAYDAVVEAYEHALETGHVSKDTTLEDFFNNAETKSEAEAAAQTGSGDLSFKIDNDFRKVAEQLTNLRRQEVDYHKLMEEAASKSEYQIKVEEVAFDEVTEDYIDENGNKASKIVKKVRTDAEGKPVTTTRTVTNYRNVFKEIADQSAVEEQTYARQIDEIEKGTRGMGEVDETFSRGDF